MSLLVYQSVLKTSCKLLVLVKTSIKHQLNTIFDKESYEILRCAIFLSKNMAGGGSQKSTPTPPLHEPQAPPSETPSVPEDSAINCLKLSTTKNASKRHMVNTTNAHRKSTKINMHVSNIKILSLWHKRVATSLVLQNSKSPGSSAMTQLLKLHETFGGPPPPMFS